MNEGSVNICLLCGLPASGKSTLMKKMIQHNHEENEPTAFLQDCIVIGVEYDDILPADSQSTCENVLIKQDNTLSWKEDRLQILRLVEALIQYIQQCGWTNLASFPQPQEVKRHVWHHFARLLSSNNVTWRKNTRHILLVIDDNMYFRSMRYEYFKLARQYRLGFLQLYLKHSIEKALERNQKRNSLHRIPDEVILRMSSKLEPPDGDKYSWEKNSVTINSELDINIHQLIPVIQEAFTNPVQPIEDNIEEKAQSRLECSANMLHQADLILRKCVASAMSQFKANKPPGELKSLSKQVFTVKESILKDLKNGQISVTLQTDSNILSSAQNPDSEFYKIISDLFTSRISQIHKK